MSERQRPNANYKLSKPDGQYIDKDNLVFHYDRERRLAKASAEVRKLYSDEKPRRIGLFSSLVGTRPNRIMFAMIVILCITVLGLSRLGHFDTFYRFEGNQIFITGVRSGGATVITVTKTIPSGWNFQNAYSGPVDVLVAPAGGDDYIIYRLFFSLAEEETHSFVVPFYVPQLDVLMMNHTAQLGIALTVD